MGGAVALAAVALGVYAGRAGWRGGEWFQLRAEGRKPGGVSSRIVYRRKPPLKPTGDEHTDVFRAICLQENSIGFVKFSSSDFGTELVLQEVLGSGSFGAVHAGDWRGRGVAVKMMHNVTGNTDLQAFRKEINVLEKLRHPRIVALVGACFTPPNVCLVQELATGGSLYSFIHEGRGRKGRKGRKGLGYLTTLQLGIDIADAMNYLHPSIVHRDLKSQNVLLDDRGRGKVCDFGIASFKDRTFLATRTSQAGTPSYMAPEMFAGAEVDEKCDVFSFGVLLWECIAGEIPWGYLTTPMQVIFAVGVQKQRLPIPEHCPPALRDLIEDCWHEEPADRPDFCTILDFLLVERRREVMEQTARNK